MVPHTESYEDGTGPHGYAQNCAYTSMGLGKTSPFMFIRERLGIDWRQTNARLRKSIRKYTHGSHSRLP